MAIIQELNNNDSVFPDVSWTSEFLNCSNSFEVIFTAFCSQNFECVIQWAVDDNHDIIASETHAVTGGDSYTFCERVKFRKVRFIVQNIAVQPSILRTNGFFFSQ
jgi:hypothetical protein